MLSKLEPVIQKYAVYNTAIVWESIFVDLEDSYNCRFVYNIDAAQNIVKYPRLASHIQQSKDKYNIITVKLKDNENIFTKTVDHL